MSEAALTLRTLAGVVVLFVSNKVPVEIAAVGSALVLWGLGIITLSDGLLEEANHGHHRLGRREMIATRIIDLFGTARPTALVLLFPFIWPFAAP